MFWIGFFFIILLPIIRAWESLSVVTCCRSLVIVYDSKVMLQIGLSASSSANSRESVTVDVSNLMQGSLYQGVQKSGSRKFDIQY